MTGQREPRRLAGTWAVGVACVLALAGCAGGPPGSPAATSPPAVLTPVPGGATPGTSEPASTLSSGPPDASASASLAPSGTDAPEAVATVGCGGTDVAFASAVLSSPVELLPDTPPGRGLRAYVETSAGAELGLPRDGWRLASLRLPNAVFVAPVADGWVFATLTEQADGSWEFFEGGRCDVVAKAPAALAFASWRLATDAPPAADASQVLVQAHEEACANGKPPADRLLPAIVDETPTTVTITILVRRLENADCQGNPRFPVDVTLSAPLGDRLLLDGSAYPPARRN
jgi:hypothetical protein